jgi:iron complex transport system ATP-binding protein
MGEFRGVPLTELSDGMFQKTMIARALAQQTPFILLDEPSAFLDYASRHKLFGQLKELATNERKCILLSSHDLDLILKYCNKIALVSRGHIKVLGINEARTDAGFLEIGGGFL